MRPARSDPALRARSRLPYTGHGNHPLARSGAVRPTDHRAVVDRMSKLQEETAWLSVSGELTVMQDRPRTTVGELPRSSARTSCRGTRRGRPRTAPRRLARALA